MTCVRQAWLTLDDGSTIGLEGVGYHCTSLDLGYGVPREVTQNRADADGAVDRTSLMGPRVIQASITALAAGGASIDTVAASFAKYMVPSQRPTLHYVLDRPGAVERLLTLRASAYAWPIVGPSQRDISLQWVAPDPVARATETQSATAWAGASVGGGRIYDLRFDRSYPLGGAAGPTPAQVSGNGEVPITPYLRLYGPITAPYVSFDSVAGGASWAGIFRFVDGFRVDVGHFVGVDVGAHSANMDDDPTQSVLSSLAWSSLTWPVWPNLPTVVAVNYGGTNTDYRSQCQIAWQDGYLS